VNGIIDRFEGDFAVVEHEGQNMKNIKKEILPEGVKEGTAIVFIDGQWQIDHDRTSRLKEEIDELAESLFE